MAVGCLGTRSELVLTLGLNCFPAWNSTDEVLTQFMHYFFVSYMPSGLVEMHLLL